MTKWTLRRWSCCCGPLRGGNLLSFAPSMRLSSAVAAGPVPASLSGRRRKWSIRLDRGLEATAARRWTGAGGSGRPCRIRRSCAAVVAQVCVSARPGRQPRESGTRLSPSGNVAARPWSGLTIGRGRATTTGARTCRQVTRRQWNRRAANLCSAPASRRLLSELIVIPATFGSSIRHRWRQRLAHKSRRSSRTALFTRKAMTRTSSGSHPSKAPTMAAVGVRMSMQIPLRAAGGVPLVPETARVPGAPTPRGSPGRLPHVLLAMSVAGTPPVPPLARSVLFGERPGVRRHGPTRRTCGNGSVPRLHSAHTDKESARKRHEGTLPFRPRGCGGRAPSAAGLFCRRRRSPRRGTGAWRRRAP